jgi:nucleoside-diphosphate-sugar epimerase
VIDILIDGIDAATKWHQDLKNVEVVVHLAARAHILKEKSADPLGDFRQVNLEGTLNLALQAAKSGVKRFVFISSVGVNGSQTQIGHSFSEVDQPNPHNAYAISKLEAEQGLLRISNESGLEVVIIRPPLVYGLNAPGNFGSLLRAVHRGWPLPLGAVHNQRSLVALDNLVDFIITCINHPQAANQTFLVSDGQDLSTSELVRCMAQVAGLSAHLLPVPVWALKAGASLLGRGDVVQRLCGNLQIDISKARSLLGWVPPVSVEEGLRRAMAV